MPPPSETANATIKQALLNGIEQAEKLIDEKVRNLGTVVNGWSFNLDTGNYGTNYLLRAAIARTALGVNIAQEALYPAAFVDNRGERREDNNASVTLLLNLEHFLLTVLLIYIVVFE